MGADGLINIYDLDKLQCKFGHEETTRFVNYFRSSLFYAQILEGRNYISMYHGDNIYCGDSYETIRDCYDPLKDTFREKSPSYDVFYAECFMELPKDVRKIYAEIATYLDNDCRLTTWEVWT